MRLEFGERHFDGVEVRAVGRQEEEPSAFGLDGLFGDRTLVGGQIVHDDDVAAPQRRGELGLDVGLEDAPVHRRVDDEGGGERPATQAGDEGLGFPMAEGGFGAQPPSFQAAPARAGHFGVRPRLVDEHQALRLKPHSRLALVDPGLARLADVGMIAFARLESFF